MEYKLDACPFCDGIGELVFSEIKDLNIPVKCKICGAQTIDLKSWNSRTDDKASYELGYAAAQEDAINAIYNL